MSTDKLKLKNVVVSYSDDDDESDDYQVEKRDDTELEQLVLEKLSLGKKKKKKKLLALSLGGFLFHRAYRYDSSKIPKLRSPDTRYGSFLVYKRPFVEDFLKFCFERFDVGLWSSAREWYVDNALDCIMKGLKQKLMFIWDQNKCTDTGFKCLDNKHKPVYLKELRKLWDNAYGDLTWSKGRYSVSNTLMIDDEPYKSLMNPANTAVFLHQYNADDLEDDVLAPNGGVRKYLDGVAEAENVQDYLKTHPFGRPAISPSHADWNFYSGIVKAMKSY